MVSRYPCRCQNEESYLGLEFFVLRIAPDKLFVGDLEIKIISSSDILKLSQWG